MLKEIIANVKFAMENGFTDVKIEALNEEEILLVGAFGQVIIGAHELPEVLEVIVPYKTKEETTAVETTEAVEVAEVKEEATQAETNKYTFFLNSNEYKVMDQETFIQEVNKLAAKLPETKRVSYGVKFETREDELEFFGKDFVKFRSNCQTYAENGKIKHMAKFYTNLSKDGGFDNKHVNKRLKTIIEYFNK